MSKPPSTPQAVPGRDDLVAGLLAAFGIYVGEADLRHAVGESGLVNVNLQLHLERGRVQWSKGGVWFERRIDMKGAS